MLHLIKIRIKDKLYNICYIKLKLELRINCIIYVTY